MSEDLCRRYLEALSSGELAAVRTLFTADAVVVSPLYGHRRAHDFYEELFADTRRSETRLLRTLSSGDGTAAALHFHYRWTLTSGKTVTFECVDIFELSVDRQKFQKMTILYDTIHLRADFDASRQG